MGSQRFAVVAAQTALPLSICNVFVVHFHAIILRQKALHCPRKVVTYPQKTGQKPFFVSIKAAFLQHLLYKTHKIVNKSEICTSLLDITAGCLYNGCTNFGGSALSKEVNNAQVEKYDFSRRPRRASRFWMFIAREFAVRAVLAGYKLKIDRKNMDGLKPPYLLLASHASMMDFAVMYKAILPYKRANFVVAIDAVRDYTDWLMCRLGGIAKRKFVKDFDLIRNLRYCAKEHGDVVCMYPEARYSLDGCDSYLPPSLGKLSKLLGIPVVTLKMDGNFIIAPQWNKPRQKMPLHAEISQIVTAEELKTLSVEEINSRIKQSLTHDDYRYQLENGIENKYAKRAEGLHNLLYRCPHCNAEFQTYSQGTTLRCDACGKEWEMTTLGQLVAKEGETEFSHIPDWFNWQRKVVREEVRNGTYRFEDEVDVHTLPNAKKFYHHGKGKLVQTPEGTVLDCIAYGQPTHVEWAATELESIHIEYDYPFNKKLYKNNVFGDCVDISTNDESYWLHPATKRTQLTKLSLATEEIYFWALEKIKKGE